MTVYREISRHSGDERRAITTGHNPQAGLAEGACPGCGVSPFLVVGAGLFRDGRRWKSAGKCVACGDNVGWIFAEADTIFGEEEDRAVIEHARGRVY